VVVSRSDARRHAMTEPRAGAAANDLMDLVTTLNNLGNGALGELLTRPQRA
jgi:hypothetical protein